MVTPVISFQTVKRSAISWRHPLADSRCRRGRKCGEMRLNADLGDHTHGPLTQLRRIPPRRTTCHDSNPPNKWSLRTSRGDSRRVHLASWPDSPGHRGARQEVQRLTRNATQSNPWLSSVLLQNLLRRTRLARRLTRLSRCSYDPRRRRIRHALATFVSIVRLTGAVRDRCLTDHGKSYRCRRTDGRRRRRSGRRP